MSTPREAALSPPPAHETPILQLAGIAKSFESGGQQVEVLRPLSLEILAGEWVVLFGPSGCGKSTLLNIIAGLDLPSEGEVRLEGRPVAKPGNDRLMMFQEHALFPWLKVVDNVAYGLRWQRGYRFKPRRRRERALDLLNVVHLGQFAHALIHELSGGMKQRAALARALAPDPKVLLIDEPFPALDALVRAKMYDELQDLFVRTRKTIVSVTHDPREAACLADRVLVLTGRPAEIKVEIKVNLPRPRDINDPQVAVFASQITAQLEEDRNEPGPGAKL